ncbi:hypothetical protein OD91_1385 [Lutibacter sp. Hel_I_33_5]|uniref:hypothetical protein n=1 Tax=Lutibacter sp. Hel_I_33_5 TaxID=1566289 RepID=UPI0011A44DA4|nr:hypothetical protein [Lutibacter sp. Hel_I_33_5]TVZ56106.1 hypothetical protein OD91_1385 [Lutibacter sp. Hel_I_33_5]
MFSSEKWQKFKNIIFKVLDIETDEEVSLIEEAEEIRQLPDEYLERFTLYSLQSKEALKGRENGLLSLERAYDNWKIVKAPLLVVTNPGEGATSLLHASTYIYPSARILESHEAIDTYQKLINHLQKDLQIDQEFKTLKDLKDYIVENIEESVIILENIERLFIRKINGFNLLEDFLLFLHATKKHIYWIISVNKYSFYFLNRVKFFSSHFPYVINLNPIENQELKEDILARNSGYSMVFLKPDTITKKLENQLKKLSKEERQKQLEELFFKKLFEFANGNMSKAILYARNSAFNVKEKSVYIKPYEPKIIEELKLSDLFILEAIFQHRALTINELNVVLRNSNRQSRLTIEKLLEKNLIRTTQNKKGDTEYRINLMYLDELKNRLRERLNRNIK